MIERINAAGSRSSRSTCRRASTPRPARCPARRCAPTSPSRSAPRRSGSRSRRGASTPARCRSRRSGSRSPGTSTRSSPRPMLADGAAQDAREHEVPRRLRARRRRLAGADRRADARGARRVPRRRRLRHRRRARVGPAGDRGAAARGGQAAAAGGLGRPAARRARPTPSSRRPSGRTRSRSGRGSAAATARASSCAILLERLELPVVLDADALWELEPFERAAPTVLTPHSGELARLLGADVPRGRRAPARGGAPGRLASTARSCCSRAPTRSSRRRARASSSRPTASRRSRPPARGDVLTGVIAAFLAKGLEPQLAAAAGAVAHGLASRLVEPQRRPRRERPAAGDPARARRRRLGARAARLSARCAARSRSTSARCGATRGGCSTRSAAPSSGRSSRRTATATARSTAPGGARRRRDRALRRDARRRRSSCAAAARGADPRHGPDAADGDRRGARGAARARCVGGAIPEGVPVHVKLDTGMGRWGVSELAAPPRNVVGLMTHLATADSDPDFARRQIGAVPRGDGAATRT